jgi:hypothetical protein
MKKGILYLLTIVALVISACYKDKGNYEYSMPETPKVATLDTVYSVFVGDSLIIEPGVSMQNGTGHLTYDWKIAVPS